MSNDKDSAVLDLCPWCQKTATHGDSSYGYWTAFCGDENECPVSPHVEAPTEDEVIAAWNTRQHGALRLAAQHMCAAWKDGDQDDIETAEANLRAALNGEEPIYEVADNTHQPAQSDLPILTIQNPKTFNKEELFRINADGTVTGDIVNASEAAKVFFDCFGDLILRNMRQPAQSIEDLKVCPMNSSTLYMMKKNHD